MRRSVVALCAFFAATFLSSHAQVTQSADARGLSITAGGMVSGFQPDEGNNDLGGLGTYVDVHLTHWIQVEGEARWLRFNQYYGEHQDNYLIGPRVPIKQFGRATVYGKALIGLGKMTFPFNYGYGSFTALAYGGTVDYKLSRKLSLRAIDFEYQQWPKWLNNNSLYPYGISVGVGYKVF